VSVPARVAGCEATAMTVTADQELAFAGPGAQAELVRAGEVSPRELVELSLRRIEALNPGLNAVRVTLAEQALAAADAPSDPDLPLRGVPFAVKDDTPVAGQATTRGSRSYGPPATADAEVVRRLRAAGAIPVSITNVPELTIFPWTASDANGITRNPWNLGRTPGGSSGGSAAAVAAGMVPAATGSDGGGSIRIPAACCGLVGMKPTRGRVSMAPASEGGLGLATYGPLARSVRDSALLLDAMAEPTGAPLVAACSAPPGRLRIGFSRKLPPGLIARLSPEQHGAWEQTGLLLEGLGHELLERDPDYPLLATTHFTESWARGIYEESLLIPDRSKLERSSRQIAGFGRFRVSSRRRERLRGPLRAATTARVLAVWEEIDVLLTPVLARTAIAAEGGYGRAAPVALDRAARFMPWTPVFNITGQPAVAVPAGFGADGLPLSVQLAGRIGAEDVLYALAAQLEAARPWAHHRPPTV
jgi:amidase